MPDGKALIDKRLGDLRLPPTEKQEIVTELASHLEDLYEALLSELSEEVAIKKSLDQVQDWQALAKQIRRAKNKGEHMNQRTKEVWLPGCVTLAMTMGMLLVLPRFDLQPQTMSFGPLVLTFYYPWLVALPLFGAAGAYLSRRAGGTRATQAAGA